MTPSGISADVPAGDTPDTVISVPVPGVTYSSAAVMLTRSNTLEGAAVEAMIRPAEMDRSEPSEGRLMTLTASAPSGRAA